MKDYSNYYPSPYEKVKNDSILLTTRQIEVDGEIYKVDDVDYPLIVEHHSNPLTEQKEERKVLCSMDTPLHWGSVVEDISDMEKYNNKTHDVYIVISDIDIHNNVYKETKMQKANKSIKWQDETGKMCECPVISKDASIYTDGVQENKQITTLDTKVNIIVPLNADTIKLNIDKRIIITRRVYKITMVNDYERTDKNLTEGTINITMTVEAENPNDRIDLGIADYVEHVYNLQVLNGDTINLQKDKSIQIQVKCFDNGVEVINPANITYTSNNINICTINDTNILGINTGTTIVSVAWNGIVKTIQVNVFYEPQTNTTYSLTTSTGINEIMYGKQKKYTAKQYINNVETTQGFVFSILYGDTPTSAVQLTTIDANNCYVKCLEYGYNITLVATNDKNARDYITQEIQLIPVV